MIEPSPRPAPPPKIPAPAADRRSNRAQRTLVTAACLVILFAGLRLAADILQPLVLALFLATLSLPLQVWLQKKGLPTPLAVMVTFLAGLAVLVVIALMVGGSFRAFTEEAPKYQARIGELVESSQVWLVERGIGDAERLNLSNVLRPGAVMDLVGTTLRAVTDVVSNLFLVLLLMIFLLAEATGLPDKLRLAFGFTRENDARFRNAIAQVQRYLGIKTLVSLMTGVLIWAALALIGIDFAILWGLIAFLLNYIPNLGSIFAAIPAVLLALVQKGPGAALLVALLYLTVNILLGNILEPNLMGRRLGLSTLVIFVSLIFWGWLWGPIGMLISVPLTMVLKIAMENSRSHRWIAVVLSDHRSIQRNLTRAEPPSSAPA